MKHFPFYLTISSLSLLDNLDYHFAFFSAGLSLPLSFRQSTSLLCVVPIDVCTRTPCLQRYSNVIVFGRQEVLARFVS